MTLDEVLNGAFFALHTLLIGFNLTGWAWRRTRVAHLVVLSATLFSWVVIGAYYGWGYCLCTDWHFQVRRRLGYAGPETSFLQLLASRAFGIRPSKSTADALAVGGLAAILVATAASWAPALSRGRSGGPGRPPDKASDR